MSFYHFQEEMGEFLKYILNKLSNNQRNYLQEDLSITWINYKKSHSNFKSYGYGLNNKKQIYPASIIKLVYGLAIHTWIEKGILIKNDQICDAVYRMLYNSSNDATSFIVDLLTGTSSGPSIKGDSWNNWKYQREIVNDWLRDLNWDELKGTNCCQKTWEDAPFGREKDFYGPKNQNRNSISSDGAARIMEQIMKNIQYKETNINIKKFLSRNLSRESFEDDPNNQIAGFLGEGLPENTPFWSKAGLMSEVRHDSAFWSINENTETLLVVFGNGEEFVRDKLFFPKLAEEIFSFKE